MSYKIDCSKCDKDLGYAESESNGQELCLECYSARKQRRHDENVQTPWSLSVLKDELGDALQEKYILTKTDAIKSADRILVLEGQIKDLKIAINILKKVPEQNS